MKAFYSKSSKSYLITTYILATVLLAVAPPLISIPQVKSQITGCFALVVFLMIICLMYPFRYIFGKENLRVKMGLVYVRTIPYDSIERVTFVDKGMAPIPTWSPFNSGIKLILKNRAAFISPADEQGVFEELAERCPQLRKYGNELRIEAN